MSLPGAYSLLDVHVLAASGECLLAFFVDALQCLWCVLQVESSCPSDDCASCQSENLGALAACVGGVKLGDASGDVVLGAAESVVELAVVFAYYPV